MLTSAPLLVFPDFSKQFILETDASGLGLGAILSQEQSDRLIAPIAYASRTLQQHEANYGISELEALAVVWATKHFTVYLYGHPCDVYTDVEYTDLEKSIRMQMPCRESNAAPIN